MTDAHLAYPMVISLPDGVEARVRIVHVTKTNKNGKELLTQAVQTPPVYETDDGVALDLDVTIPDDLVAVGWFWFGSTLMRGDPYGPNIGVHTSCYPPPGWPAPMGTCFDSARRVEAASTDRQALRVAERVAIATKSKRPRRDAPLPAAVQTMMEM